MARRRKKEKAKKFEGGEEVEGETFQIQNSEDVPKKQRQRELQSGNDDDDASSWENSEGVRTMSRRYSGGSEAAPVPSSVRSFLAARDNIFFSVLETLHDFSLAPSELSSPPPSSSASSFSASQLSPELLLLIFEIASEQRNRPVLESSEFQDDWTLFSSASLVCRSWRDPAQSMLWRRIYLADQAKMEKLLKSDARGVYQTKYLGLSGFYRALEKEDVEMVIEALTGIRTLKLTSYHEMPLEVMSLPSLAGLTRLIVYDLSFTSTSEATLSLPSFSLKSLEFMIQTPYEPSPFFSHFYSPTLRSLRIDYTLARLKPSSLVDAALLLKKSAPHIEKLSLIFGASISTISALFPLFTSLKTLHLAFDEKLLIPILSSIPSGLTTLRLHYNVAGPVILVIKQILGLPSMNGLEKLVLESYHKRSFVHGMRDPNSIFEWIKERKVELEFGEIDEKPKDWERFNVRN